MKITKNLLAKVILEVLEETEEVSQNRRAGDRNYGASGVGPPGKDPDRWRDAFFAEHWRYNETADKLLEIEDGLVYLFEIAADGDQQEIQDLIKTLIHRARHKSWKKQR